MDYSPGVVESGAVQTELEAISRAIGQLANADALTPGGIQRLLDEGGDVYVTGGDYTLTVPLTIYSNTHLRLAADATLTQSTAGEPVIQGDDVSNVTIEGGTWVGADNSTAIDSGDGGLIYIDNRGATNGGVRIQNTTVMTSGTAGISCLSVDGLWIQDNDVSDCADYAVLASRCDNFNISDNYLHDSAETGAANTYGISATGSTAGSDDQERCIIAGNVIENFASWDGIMTHGCLKLSVVNNVIDNVRVGLDISLTPSTNDMEDILVVGNTINLTSDDNYAAAGAQSGGIKLIGQASKQIERGTICNNIINNFGNMSGATISGDSAPIVVEHTRLVTVVGNVIDGVGSTGVAATGVFIVGDCEQISVIGNAMTGDMDAGGVRFASVTADAASVVGNTVIQTTATNNAVAITGSTIGRLSTDLNPTNSTAPFIASTSTLTWEGGRIRTDQASANTNTPSGATAQQLPIYDDTNTLLGYVPVYGSAW
jgi:hypothetical protein